jgi:hypothetical protein
MVGIGLSLPVGAVVGRWLDRDVRRSVIDA